MEPDRFEEIEADEQRAVMAVNEEYLQLQKRVPVVPGESSRSRGRMLVAVLVLLLVVALAIAVLVLLR